MKTRRALLQALAGAAGASVLGGCAGRRPFAGVTPTAPELTTGAGSLKAHAAVRGFLYGCAVDTGLLERDLRYAELLCSQANVVVAENAMKWDALRPSPGAYRFDDADALLSFAERNRMKVRGHTLCSHRQLPGWFAAEANATSARGLLTEHIARVAGRYAGRMHSWDVVNEPVLVEDGRADGLRDSPWLRMVGAEYLEVAFGAAREADPQALLTLNEYGLEAEDQAGASKRAAMLILLRRMKARRVPVDAVGIQSHLMAGHSYGAGLAEFMAAVRGMGLQVFLTEMDVNDRELPKSEEVRDGLVAASYRRYLELAMREPAVRVVMTWGISDRSTWLNEDGARWQRSLPFDRDGRAKAAFFAVRDSFDRRVAG